MLKEIHEQPEALRQSHHRAGRRATAASTSRSSTALADAILGASTRVELVACGSAFYAALVGAAALQEWTGLPGPGDGRLGVPLQPAAARRARRSSSP